MIREETNGEDPRALALGALSWVLADEARVERFVGLTGLTGDDIRARINTVELLDAVLAYLEGNEADLVACAATLDVMPMVLTHARAKLNMSRPLLITDCDEVLLHMVVPFANWVDEAHDVHFDLDFADFARSLRHKATGEIVAGEQIWPMLRGFFATEMHRQRPIAGAVEAVNHIAETADIVVLTNLTDDENLARRAQLKQVGLDFPVITNQGGKGEALARILDQYGPSSAVFVDDLVHQHDSVAEHAPEVWRLHMVGEPRLASRIPAARAAHARIDDWESAKHWILSRFAPTLEGVTREQS